MKYDFVLYDTAPFANAANTDLTLFQVPRGGDATHNEQYTNMRGAGTLPANEQFDVSWIGLIIDHNTLIADIPKIQVASFFEFIYMDKSILKLPLAMIIAASAYGGFYTQAAAADEAAIGLLGNGLSLNLPIVIKGGDAFRARVYQGTALSGTVNFKLAFRGIYDDKSS